MTDFLKAAQQLQAVERSVTDAEIVLTDGATDLKDRIHAITSGRFLMELLSDVIDVEPNLVSTSYLEGSGGLALEAGSGGFEDTEFFEDDISDFDKTKSLQGK